MKNFLYPLVSLDSPQKITISGLPPPTHCQVSFFLWNFFPQCISKFIAKDTFTLPTNDSPWRQNSHLLDYGGLGILSKGHKDKLRKQRKWEWWMSAQTQLRWQRFLPETQSTVKQGIWDLTQHFRGLYLKIYNRQSFANMSSFWMKRLWHECDEMPFRTTEREHVWVSETCARQGNEVRFKLDWVSSFRVLLLQWKTRHESSTYSST